MTSEQELIGLFLKEFVFLGQTLLLALQLQNLPIFVPNLLL